MRTLTGLVVLAAVTAVAGCGSSSSSSNPAPDVGGSPDSSCPAVVAVLCSPAPPSELPVPTEAPSPSVVTTPSPIASASASPTDTASPGAVLSPTAVPTASAAPTTAATPTTAPAVATTPAATAKASTTAAASDPTATATVHAQNGPGASVTEADVQQVHSGGHRQSYDLVTIHYLVTNTGSTSADLAVTTSCVRDGSQPHSGNGTTTVPGVAAGQTVTVTVGPLRVGFSTGQAAYGIRCGAPEVSRS